MKKSFINKVASILDLEPSDNIKHQVVTEWVPLPNEPYFVFSDRGFMDDDSKYKFWDVVVSIIKVHSPETKFLQILDGNSRVCPMTDYSFKVEKVESLNFVLQNSDGYLGACNLAAHLVNAFGNKPVTTIHGELRGEYEAIVSDSWKAIDASKNPKSNPQYPLVNKIKPEHIAETFLGIKISDKTEVLGEAFGQISVYVIPTANADLDKSSIHAIRMDVEHNEEVLKSLVEQKKVDIVCNKPFDLKPLKKENINSIIYVADSLDDEFLREIKENKIGRKLFCSDKNNLPKERLRNFFDVILSYNKQEIADKLKEKYGLDEIPASFISGRPVIEGEKTYQSLHEYTKDENDFFTDLDFVVSFKNES